MKIEEPKAEFNKKFQALKKNKKNSETDSRKLRTLELEKMEN